ncbi:ribbon-helix-helix domain-containing protein [Devosia sp. J2-20]|jgi:predicted DNA-binding ribbon-helix-helix protein|uniref:ribbon-helix-helix domain-containing protein n=1 Tax=Devosia TaxID=46913 RepID=UPI0022AF7743|nr:MULTISPECIES: ribbon-helix-helix domain-containing protein [Devosia]MCZ4345801.1 ribbon-helix-helix domain-containing protein [Devosia neptuniae]WDQ99064.1 ribbon-helix-helix domain-containing protein [Devosia sp. J2-20]|tara:strand:+ start:4448 stop:4669 length:222 start_codon:yes stop_codon:yes gene_type:complete
MDKRSLSISGHRTSIALEPQFWAALEQMAAESGQTMTALICSIDADRQTDNLSSAARLAVLRWYQAKVGNATS